ncbi:MAG: hypothetical protein CSA32_02175 [Desulfobulbus propionicus]|nr:MAG: hypothetical protein CSA32_02175 [Desulfobulbus propionicus]
MGLCEPQVQRYLAGQTVKFPELSINGRVYSHDELLELAKVYGQLPEKEQWLQPLYQFIGQWLDDSQLIQLQTSGSTGAPKIIDVPKKALIASAEATASFFRFRRGDTILLCLPTDFIAGKMTVVRAFVSGLNLLAIPPSQNPLQQSGEVKIKMAPLVPMQLERLFAGSYPENDIVKILGRIENILLGGTALNNRLHRKLEEYGPRCSCNCYLGYGMTETCSHIALQKIGTTTKKLFTAMAGVSCTVNSRGQLVISAPHLGIDRLVTNDIVRLHSTTQFALLGRTDNVINSGGLKIYPEKVEEKLETILQDYRYFIHAVADPVLGQSVTLFLESLPKKSTELAALLSAIRTVVGKYEVPRKIICVKQFSLTSSGKIKRQKTVDNALA